MPSSHYIHDPISGHRSNSSRPLAHCYLICDELTAVRAMDHEPTGPLRLFPYQSIEKSHGSTSLQRMWDSLADTLHDKLNATLCNACITESAPRLNHMQMSQDRNIQWSGSLRPRDGNSTASDKFARGWLMCSATRLTMPIPSAHHGRSNLNDDKKKQAFRLNAQQEHSAKCATQRPPVFLRDSNTKLEHYTTHWSLLHARWSE